MEGHRERCAPHGLTVGPDGRCVLCRQQSVAPAQEPAVGSAALRNPFVWTAIAAALLAVAGIAKAAYSRAMAQGEQAAAPVVNVVAPTSPSVIEPEPATPPTAAGDHPKAISVATPTILTPPPPELRNRRSDLQPLRCRPHRSSAQVGKSHRRPKRSCARHSAAYRSRCTRPIGARRARTRAPGFEPTASRSTIAMWTRAKVRAALSSRSTRKAASPPRRRR